ncbi:hypothetical protein HUK38_00770 [Thiospirillum jenense]|uniref:PD-(D/E)XK nuclease family transposase n=2 Tax=Thiospirillum jenense TaxID=1653858 RepID=A0A839H4J7_9GAMM|nr:hypothetical protein [Thiospirillum jenense]
MRELIQTADRRQSIQSTPNTDYFTRVVPMRIANPIYDSVFKYLLEDNQLAKLIISTILGEEIIELDCRPQEQIAVHSLTVYRLDFAATIKNAAGEYRKVLIEIQKAKFETDIMRFRRYLGTQYADVNNVRIEQGNKQALPLVTIYFLGHPLNYITAPVIRVGREYYDLTTNESIAEREPFIESLTHDSYIIQIPRLRQDHRSEVEELLQVFNQDKIPGVNKHILEIQEDEVAERYRPIIRRLHRAIAERPVIDAMDVEDEVLEELQKLERKADQERIEKERALADKELALIEKEQALAEKDRERIEKEFVLAEKERILAQQQRECVEKEQALAEQQRLLALLKNAGIDPNQ